MATRVLIINRQLVFAVTIKQALEQTGRFDVHLFTTADAAFEFLREHPQDVALLDYMLPGRSGAKVVQQLRSFQNDLAIVISPRQPEGDVRHLNIQGMIDMPFTARDVIPLIERALDPTAAPPIQTRHFDEDPLPTAGQSSTKTLGEEEQYQERQRGTTQLFNQPPPEPENRPQTQILDEPPPPALRKPPAQAAPPAPPQPQAKADQDKTKKLDDEALENWKPSPQNPKPAERKRTKSLEDSQPATPPEFSNLDAVLKSFGFDPPIAEGDTPSVPMKDSDALRQFLATASNVTEGDSFDDVLEAIDSEEFDEQPRPSRSADFEGLVNSMRRDAPHQNLPNRQQQLMDFILSTGMDSVLQEIEKTKTGTTPLPPVLPEEKQPQPPKRKKRTETFEKLSQEEPPMPTLEESGTVSDLLLGINDSSFNDVLSILRGEEVEPREARPQRTSATRPPREEVSNASPMTGRQKLDEEQEDPAQLRSVSKQAKPAPPKPTKLPGEKPKPKPAPEPELDLEFEPPDDEASVAQVVLRATLDDSDMPDGFSLNRLMTDIEDRLSEHKLNIRPLPSWDMDTTQFRAISDRASIAEPSFLPEELPPGEILRRGELPDLPSNEPESYTGRTTRASQAERSRLDDLPEDPDTMFDLARTEDTAPSKPVRVDFVPDADIDVPDVIEDTTPGAAIADHWDSPLPQETVPRNPLEGLWDNLIVPSEADEAPYDEVQYDEEPQFEENEAAESYYEDEAVVYDEEPVEEPNIDHIYLDLESESAPEEQPAFLADMLDVYPPEFEEPVEVEEQPVAEGEDTYLAQLALNLTQVSLELSAEGTLLTREGEIVAYAGHLSQADTSELRQMIQDDWESTAGGARVRFITLPSSNKDYMLYSIRTEDGLTLSMIFAGTTPLRIIRKQAQRLVEALQNVPEVAVEAPAPPKVDAIVPVDPGPLNPFAYVWSVRDANAQLSDAAIQAITAGLSTQLQEMRWQIQDLQVQGDFVYLLAAVPGETPSNELMRDLKQRSAAIAQAQDPTLSLNELWADSYLILAPGRALDPDEIMEYIHFQRMV